MRCSVCFPFRNGHQVIIIHIATARLHMSKVSRMEALALHSHCTRCLFPVQCRSKRAEGCMPCHQQGLLNLPLLTVPDFNRSQKMLKAAPRYLWMFNELCKFEIKLLNSTVFAAQAVPIQKSSASGTCAVSCLQRPSNRRAKAHSPLD